MTIAPDILNVIRVAMWLFFVLLILDIIAFASRPHFRIGALITKLDEKIIPELMWIFTTYVPGECNYDELGEKLLRVYNKLTKTKNKLGKLLMKASDNGRVTTEDSLVCLIQIDRIDNLIFEMNEFLKEANKDIEIMDHEGE